MTAATDGAPKRRSRQVPIILAVLVVVLLVSVGLWFESQTKRFPDGLIPPEWIVYSEVGQIGGLCFLTLEPCDGINRSYLTSLDGATAAKQLTETAKAHGWEVMADSPGVLLATSRAKRAAVVIGFDGDRAYATYRADEANPDRFRADDEQDPP